MCYLNPDLAMVKIACSWNGDRTIHLFGTVYVRSARRVALFSALGKMELKKCGGRFRFLGVDSVSLCQTVHSTGWSSFQVCHSFFWVSFTYPGVGDLQQEIVLIRKIQEALKEYMF